MEKFNVLDAYRLCEENLAVILDVRSNIEFSQKIPNVPKVIHIPHNELEERWIILPVNMKILIFDTQGEKVKSIAKYLYGLNFEVGYIERGMLDWEEKLLPLMSMNKSCLHNHLCECACKKM